MNAAVARGRTMQRRAAMTGVSMIEVLVALLLTALWLLANAGLQVGAMKFQSGAASRYSAIALASELSERMEVNAKGAIEGRYALAETGSAYAVQIDCFAVACTPAQIAAYDLAQWTERALAEIKQLKSVSVVDNTPAGGLATYTITIRWSEPRGRQSYEASADPAAPGTETMSYVSTKVIRNASS